MNESNFGQIFEYSSDSISPVSRFFLDWYIFSNSSKFDKGGADSIVLAIFFGGNNNLIS